MALSLSNFLYAICAFSLFSLSKTETVTFNWNVTWVTANPDGMFNRRTMGINGQWPVPAVNITKGDRVVVNLYNGLGDQSTSLHFHGMFQNGTTEMDGPVGVSQCGIPPGSSFTYNFTVEQPGTYWYVGRACSCIERSFTSPAGTTLTSEDSIQTVFEVNILKIQHFIYCTDFVRSCLRP